MGVRRTFYVIAYDVPSNRRRLRIARLLEGYGERVQYSVFEMWLTGEEWRRLRRQLQALLNGKEDQVRVYRLCRACVEQFEVLGKGEQPSPPGPVVVW